MNFPVNAKLHFICNLARLIMDSFLNAESIWLHRDAALLASGYTEGLRLSEY